MKTKLLTLAAAIGLTFGAKAQAPVFASDLENWGTSAATFTNSPTSPTDWMGSKTTASIAVTKVTSGAKHGSAAVNIVNTATTAIRFTTQPTAITAGTAYVVSFWAKGKGSVRVGLYTGKSTNSGFGYATYGNYQNVSSSSNWYKYAESVVADTTWAGGQFILSVKSTGTSGSITGVDIDSVTVIPYTIQTKSLYDVQYTPLANGNSPYFGRIVRTGGIITATYTSGYYVQTSGSSSWSGALVYDFNKHPVMGDSVIFNSTVDEYFNMTELSAVDTNNYVIASHGNQLPAPVVLSTNNVNQEMYEGILVTVNNANCVSTATTIPYATVNDGSGAAYVDKQMYTYAFTPGTSYSITGPVNYNYQFDIEPRFAADITAVSGIEKYENSLHATVYPNPMTNELTIQLPVVSDKITVTVTDIMGRELASEKAKGSVVSLSNLDLAAGTYFVKITADGKSQTTKVIKQ